MAEEPNARDAKLIQYLTEAHGKEKELETALQAHIAMTTRDSYRKRLQDHLKETKEHGRLVERRVKALGGDVSGGVAGTAASVANKAIAAAQGPLHMVRGTGEQEKLLKNAKTEYMNEAEEIATYTAIEALATALGDRETAQVARTIRKQEERMASFLEKLIPTLTKAVVTEEIPAAERRSSNGGRRARATSSRAKSSSRSTSARSGSSRASGTRSTAKSAGRSTAAKKTGRTTTAKTTSRSSAVKSGTRKRSAGTSRASGTRAKAGSRS